MTTHDLTLDHPDRRGCGGSADRVEGAGTASTLSPVVTGLLGGLLVALVARSLVLVAAALVPAAVGAAHDVRVRAVPDRWVVSTAAVAAVAALITSGPTGLVAAGVGAAGAGLPHVVAHVAAPARLGFGDVKLAGALGAVVGPAASTIGEQLMLAAMLTAGAAAVGLVVAAAVRRRDVPYAPALVFSTIGVLMAAQPLGAVPA